MSAGTMAAVPLCLAVVDATGSWITVAWGDGTTRTCARVRGLPPVRSGDRVLVQPLADGHVVTAVLDDGSPDELVIEAGRQVTIRCGEGSLIIRRDGRVLIRGLDIVCRATRANRIKGAQVAIN